MSFVRRLRQRFVPFNINVKPGQNVSFVWGAGVSSIGEKSGVCRRRLEGFLEC